MPATPHTAPKPAQTRLSPTLSSARWVGGAACRTCMPCMRRMARSISLPISALPAPAVSKEKKPRRPRSSWRDTPHAHHLPSSPCRPALPRPAPPRPASPAEAGQHRAAWPRQGRVGSAGAVRAWAGQGGTTVLTSNAVSTGGTCAWQ
jgi:hypothetical protein